VDMHATDLVGINCITRVLLVYSCQQGVYPRGHVLPLRLPQISMSKETVFYCKHCGRDANGEHLAIRPATVTYLKFIEYSGM
jgi:hypothetical protein